MHDARHCGYLDSKASGGSSSQVRPTRPNDPCKPACLSSGASSAEQRRSRAQAATTLPTQSQHQLPMWLAKSLHQRSHIHIDLPACYGPTFREGLRSDPSFVNLHNHSEYYFGVGVDLARLCARPPARALPTHRPWRPGARALRGAVRAWRCSQAGRGAARAARDSLQQALAGADDDGAERGSAAGPFRRHGQAHAAGEATCAAPARNPPPTRLSASVRLHPIRSPRLTPPCPPRVHPAVLEAGREAKNSFEKWRSRQTKMESSALVGHKRHAPNSRRAAPRQKQHS